jgi:hypothetical protein
VSIAGTRIEPHANFGEESLELSSAHARSNREHLDRKSRDEVYGKIKGAAPSPRLADVCTWVFAARRKSPHCCRGLQVIDGRRDAASHPRGSAIEPDDIRRREVAQVTSGGRIPRPLATGTAGSDTSLRPQGRRRAATSHFRSAARRNCCPFSRRSQPAISYRIWFAKLLILTTCQRCWAS